VDSVILVPYLPDVGTIAYGIIISLCQPIPTLFVVIFYTPMNYGRVGVLDGSLSLGKRKAGILPGLR
jgi:hypothetical protein